MLIAGCTGDKFSSSIEEFSSYEEVAGAGEDDLKIHDFRLKNRSLLIFEASALDPFSSDQCNITMRGVPVYDQELDQYTLESRAEGDQILILAYQLLNGDRIEGTLSSHSSKDQRFNGQWTFELKNSTK
ncbi:hypothetical protein Rhal01_03724 [Rubritalea halochordaticola]|uniref:Lipoprotein n=2 Tax=Rubritalea halochordaticola TaxID=714537 RepID=A0ABP9V4C8_9BACT